MDNIIENHLNKIKIHLQRYINYTFKNLNIKSSEIKFLRVLENIGKTSQIELSRKLDCDKAHINRITNKLLEKGLINFSNNDLTKVRKYILEITDIGKEIIKKANHAMSQWMKFVVKEINQKDLSVFKNVVERISLNASKIKLENE